MHVGCTVVCEDSDNIGALHLASNPATTPNGKHIDMRHHFICERVDRGEFRIVHVCALSRFQHADFLTKRLWREVFYFHTTDRRFVMNLG